MRKSAARIISVLLILVLALAMLFSAGCSSVSSKPADNDTSDVSSTVTVPTVSPVAETVQPVLRQDSEKDKEPETKTVYVNHYTTKTVVREVDNSILKSFTQAYLAAGNSASMSDNKAVFSISANENGTIGLIADDKVYSIPAPDGISINISSVNDDFIYILFDTAAQTLSAHGNSSVPDGEYASVAILQPAKNWYYGVNEVSFEKPLLSQLQNGCTIKFLGDSITAGAGSSDDDRKTSDVFMTIGTKEYRRQLGKLCYTGLFTDYMSEKFGNTVINNGISGITSTVLRRELPRLVDENDDVIFLMVGTNNRSSETGLTRLYDDLTYMVTDLRSQGKTVVLMSPTPATVASDGKASHIFHVEDIANTISMVADEQDVTYIDNYNYVLGFVAAGGRTIEELMVADGCLSDGLHPTDEVHGLIFKNILQTIGLAPKTDGATW